MATGNVTVVMKAADAELVRAWQRAQQGPKEMAEELEKVRGKSNQLRRSSDHLGQSLVSSTAGAIIGFTSLSGAVSTLISKLYEAIAAQKELDKKRDVASTTTDEATTRFLMQSQLSNVPEDQRRKIATRVAKEGTAYGIKPQESINLARELTSQGVDIGNVAEVMQISEKFAAAQGEQLNLDFLKPLIAQARVQDEKLTPAAFEETAKAFFGSYLGRQIQPAQLAPFSRVNVGLKAAGMNAAEQIALNTASLDLYGGSADQAATFDRAFINHLRAPTPEAAKALQTMGLQPEDVDFIDEKLSTVLDRLAAGLQQLDATARVPALTKLFGQEYGASAAGLIENRQKIPAILADINAGAARFEPTAAALTSTDAALQRRNEAAAELGSAQHGLPHVQTGRTALAAAMEEQGANAVTQKLADWTYAASSFVFRQVGIESPALTEAQAVAAARTSTNPFTLTSMPILEAAYELARGSGTNESIARGMRRAPPPPAAPQSQAAQAHAISNHRKSLPQDAAETIASRKLDRLISLMERVVFNTGDKDVRILNPGAPSRAAARGRPRPAPIGAAAH